MKKWTVIFAVALVVCAIAVACGRNKPSGQAAAETQPNPSDLLLGKFDADSAYDFVARQVAFGPRVPGSEGHRACRQFIIDRLKAYGADSVMIQDGVVTAFNGDELPITNIIGGYNITTPRRILLIAHWDTRPWADKDDKLDERHRPIDGANDGASGVAVLLEIARNLAMRSPNVGVDLMFVDAEDYGDSSAFDPREDTWCLGSQYWINSGMPPYHPDNLPVYGILLDMVGGRNARFHYEYFSQANAPKPTIKVWSEAQKLGHSDKFIRTVGGAVTDDHIFITRAGIPTTDIIETLNVETSSFPPTWHTLDDNLDGIDKGTLKAVGETVLNVVYKEKQYE